MADFATITEEQLLHSIVQNRDGGNCRYGFLLGAGASISSNIPSAGEMAKAWLNELEHQAPLEFTGITEEKNFDPDNIASFYPQIYQRKFKHFPSDGYRAIEEYMSKTDVQPSIGYSILAQILNRTRHNVVLTTNFDRLTETALLDFEGIHARVVAHEAMLQVLPVHDQKPSIVKVHRDMICSPISTKDEVAQLDRQWSGVIQTLFDRYHFIALGYGGNDGGLMEIINNTLSDLNQAQLFWCYRNEPPTRVLEQFNDEAKAKVTLVEIHGFDEIMFKLRKRLDFPLYTDQFEKIAEEKKNRYKSQLNRIVESEGSANVATAANELLADSWREVELEVQKAETDDEKNLIYRSGIKKFPDSASLIGNYALFLHTIKKDYSAAEAYYLKALEIEPDHPYFNGNYALFLNTIKKDYDTAETHYLKALEIEPDGVNIIGNYANFLINVRKDYGRAETHYLEVLKIEPDSANVNGNYANFLNIIKKDYDAAETHYQKALDVEPGHANNNENYASFLCDIRKDYVRAETHYQKALEVEPDNANTNGNYAKLLLILDQIERAEEYLMKAEQLSGGEDTELALELAFYRLALFPGTRVESRSKIQQLLDHGIRALNWDFTEVIESAKRKGNTNIDELSSFAEQINTEPS